VKGKRNKEVYKENRKQRDELAEKVRIHLNNGRKRSKQRYDFRNSYKAQWTVKKVRSVSA
jgi:uncharacterized protein Veg